VRTLCLGAVAVLATVLPVAPASADPGDLDAAFGLGGRAGLPATASSVAVAADGTTVVGIDTRLMKVGDDGVTRPFADLSTAARAVAADPRGGFVVAGTDGSSVVLQRITATGIAAPTTAMAVGAAAISDVAVRPDGAALVTGSLGRGPGDCDQRTLVARFGPDGTPLNASSPSVNITTESGASERGAQAAVTPDGGWVIGVDYARDVVLGSHCVPLSETQFGAVVRLDPDGAPVESFGFRGVVPRGAPVLGVAASADGVWIADGWIARVHLDTGSLQVQEVANLVGRLRTDPAGRALLAGRATNDGDARPSGRLTRFLPDGRADRSFGMCGTTALPAVPSDLALREDGSVDVLAQDLLVRVMNRPGPAGTLRTRRGTWTVSSDGGVYTSGDALFCGSLGGMRLNQPIVGVSITPSRNGYWLVAADGGIFSFGSARFLGSTGALRLNQPIVGMASTPSGNGYWLVAADGGIFTFGDAGFHGSTGALRLNQPIVGMASTPSGNGYWLVAADGGIFTFGDAGFHGTPGPSAPAPFVGMAATPSGRGYTLVTLGGNVYTFGDAAYHGSITVNGPVAGIASSSGDGYWIANTNGAVMKGGDAAGGSSSARGLGSPVVGIAGG
jgi:hypothetical protein